MLACSENRISNAKQAALVWRDTCNWIFGHTSTFFGAGKCGLLTKFTHLVRVASARSTVITLFNPWAQSTHASSESSTSASCRARGKSRAPLLGSTTAAPEAGGLVGLVAHPCRASITPVGPNSSLNHRTRYGGLSWPGLGYAVQSPSPGQAIPPHRAG